ncbi:putative tRNA pseudouridine synthase Pus10 [Liparis tanakae]|uniref:Putative tRNA pseudouridine synthase Pus10 n=1 Tax=Liparis tanakae TaxID=230148 RepID=A0A4Z2E171_9TELE|nr:putative tRNA pseudouridine synthase Pus10 [Liparis tanakae]
MESSVEELIAAPVLSSFRADGESKQDGGRSLAAAGDERPGFNFSSSGREDVDVRTLGNGEKIKKII